MRPIVGLAIAAMSCLAAPLALPAQANVVPLKGAQLIADWDTFADAEPNRPTMEALHADIQACRDQGCLTGDVLSSDDIERMAWWVARGNRLAIRLSFAASGLIDNGSDGAQALAQSYGPIIKRDPTAFLAMANDEGAPARIVAADTIATSDLIAENYTAQSHELAARREALQRVADPALAGLRDQCVAVITARLQTIAAKVGGPADDGVFRPRKEAL